jgi:hypothetical protein
MLKKVRLLIEQGGYQDAVIVTGGAVNVADMREYLRVDYSRRLLTKREIDDFMKHCIRVVLEEEGLVDVRVPDND